MYSVFIAGVVLGSGTMVACYKNIKEDKMRVELPKGIFSMALSDVYCLICEIRKAIKDRSENDECAIANSILADIQKRLLTKMKKLEEVRDMSAYIEIFPQHDMSDYKPYEKSARFNSTVNALELRLNDTTLTIYLNSEKEAFELIDTMIWAIATAKPKEEK